MKYMVLIQGNQQEWSDFTKWSESDVRTMSAYMDSLNQELQAAGQWVEGNGLTGPQNMKTVRTQPSGEPLITDGPFPETKEVLAGYWIIDVPTLDRAVEFAQRVSDAPGIGGKPSHQKVEVHPVGEGPAV